MWRIYDWTNECDDSRVWSHAHVSYLLRIGPAITISMHKLIFGGP